MNDQRLSVAKARQIFALATEKADPREECRYILEHLDWHGPSAKEAQSIIDETCECLLSFGPTERDIMTVTLLASDHVLANNKELISGKNIAN